MNEQIGEEMKAFYMYRDMAYYFDRSDVALPGFYKFFKEASDEELEHADKLRVYQNKRGGTIRLDGTVLTSIVKSLNGSQAMQVAFKYSKACQRGSSEISLINSVKSGYINELKIEI